MKGKRMRRETGSETEALRKRGLFTKTLENVQELLDGANYDTERRIFSTTPSASSDGKSPIPLPQDPCTGRIFPQTAATCCRSGKRALSMRVSFRWTV